jgi:NADPH2:quinone reductase
MGTGGGGHAEYSAADAGRISPIPAGMTFEQAAALPVALQTMHDAVVTHGQLAPGQAVLIHGASSGVGLMGLQIAKLMGAGVIIGSSGNAERRERLAEFGAGLAVDASAAGWVEQIKAATDGQGVDLVVDQVSGPGINQTLRAIRILGRIVNVGRLGGMKAELDMNLHALRRITYVGVTFRSRSKAEVAQIVRDMWADLAAPLADGRISLPIDEVFEFADLPTALARMEANAHFGKIVIRR